MPRTRLANLVDAAAIAEIYNQGIEDRMATFEVDPRSVDDIASALRARFTTHPAVVVEEDGHVFAFAWASPYSSRPCYSGIAEHSVYVARAARGCGYGRMALLALIHEYEQRGYWKLESRIFPENEASRRLHHSLGFREVGIHHRHARLDGVWRDTVIVERLLGEASH